MNTIVSNSVNLLSKSNINTLNAVSKIAKQQMPMMKRTFFNVASTSNSSSLLYNNHNSLLKHNSILNNINTHVTFRFNSTEANSGKETKDEKKEEKKEEKREEKKEEKKEENKEDKKEDKKDEKEPEMDPAVKKLLESKDKKISDLQNAYKRALADTENIRERTRKEIQKSTQFAIQKFAKDLLDISDILKMALESVPEEKREDKSDNILYSLFTGVSMTRTQLLNTFKKHGLEMFNPLGEAFDANKHQAMFQTPMADKEPGIVIAVQKEGYILNGRILRPAQVGVSKKPDDSEKK